MRSVLCFQWSGTPYVQVFHCLAQAVYLRACDVFRPQWLKPHQKMQELSHDFKMHLACSGPDEPPELVNRTIAIAGPFVKRLVKEWAGRSLSSFEHLSAAAAIR